MSDDRPVCLCGSTNMIRHGFQLGKRRFRCTSCGRYSTQDGNDTYRRLLHEAALQYGLKIRAENIEAWIEVLRVLDLIGPSIRRSQTIAMLTGVLSRLAATKSSGLSGCRWYEIEAGYTTFPFVVARVCGQDEPIVIDLLRDESGEWLATAGSLTWTPFVRQKTGHVDLEMAKSAAIEFVQQAL